MTVLVSSGCGSSTPQTPRDVAVKFNAALLDGDGHTACSLLTAQEKNRFSSNCEQKISSGGPRLKALMQAEHLAPIVGQAKVTGNRATVPIRIAEQTDNYELTKSSGHWLIYRGAAAG